MMDVDDGNERVQESTSAINILWYYYYIYIGDGLTTNRQLFTSHIDAIHPPTLAADFIDRGTERPASGWEEKKQRINLFAGIRAVTDVDGVADKKQSVDGARV